MKKFGRFENNKVVEVLEAEKLPEFHPSLNWREIPDIAGEGWIERDNEIISPEDAKSLEEIKADKILEVNRIRSNKFQTFTYNGNNYQVGLEAQKDMLAVQQQLSLGVENPHGGAWRTSENKMVVMTDAEVATFLQAVFSYVMEVKKVSWYHKDTISGLSDREEIKSYDVQTGWP